MMSNNNLDYKTHDHFFRAMMSDVKLAEDFFARHLPINVKEIVDFSSLKLCKEIYVDADLRLSEVDVLYKANFADKPGYLYVLAEHQSTIDRSMPFRLLKYIVKIMDHHVKTTSRTASEVILPVIYPLVFYHGQTPYSASMDLFELFGEHIELARSILLQPFKLIDVSQSPDSELQNFSLSSTMEFLFKHIFARDILNFLEQIKGQLQLIDRQYSDSSLLNMMLKYVIHKGENSDKTKVINFIKQSFSSKIGSKMTTIAEQFIQEGRLEGRLEGDQKLENRMKMVAIKLILKGDDNKTIVNVTELSLEEVEELRRTCPLTQH